MRTIEITRIEDVQVGDVVALEDRRDSTHDDSITPDPAWRLTGRVREIRSTHSRADGTPYAWQVRIGHTPYPVGTAEWTYTLVSATREVPEWEPATAGTATVGGPDGEVELRGMWTQRGSKAPAVFTDLEGDIWGASLVRSFVPDDAEALRAEVERLEAEVDRLEEARGALERVRALADQFENPADPAPFGAATATLIRAALDGRTEVAHEGYLQAAAGWRARDRRMGAEVDRLDAEVERLTTVVGRLSCARTLPTIREIEDAISQGFELDCNLTFEGGVPQSVVGRVRDAILIARGRAND